MDRRSLVFLCSLALVCLGLTGALLYQWRDRKEEARRIEELDRENAALREEAVRQRELLRTQTLQTARRSADEFLGLFPARFPRGDWRPAETVFEDCWFTSFDGLRLHGWYLRHASPRSVILHLHGNAGNLSDRAGIAELLHDRCGSSVMLLDYRGYGRSEGTPTMLGLVRDARAARAELARREKIDEARVVLFGESLGGGIAVELAAEDGARGLVLESTFSSLRDVASAHYPPLLVGALVQDKLNSAAKIAKYSGPLLQVHGDGDQTIPLESGRTLFAAAHEPKQLIVLTNHDHDDSLPASYYEELARFLDRLP